MLHIIGLDFGNYNTFPCLIQDFDPGTHMGGMVHDLLPQRYVDGIPSVYFYSQKVGRALFGTDALSGKAIPEQNRLRYLKRNLGKSIVLDGKKVDYDTAITEVIQYCLRIANQRLDQNLQFTTNMVSLSYPATYTCAQRKRLVELVERATLEDGRHFKVHGTIAEPAAAALDYLAEEEKSGKEKTVLTYDLGGGTFDLGLVSVYPRGRKRNDGSIYYYDIINTRGISDLGGVEFSEILYGIVLKKIRSTLDSRSTARLKNAVETAKIELSDPTIPDTIVSLEVNGDFLEIPVSRTEFENAARHLVLKTIEATRGMLKDHANQKPDMILLTGGASQMPMILKEMEKAFPEYRGRIRMYRPSTAIAYGAARYGTSEIDTDPKDVETESGIVVKRLDYDIGIIKCKKKQDLLDRIIKQVYEIRFVDTIIKAGTTIPYNGKYKLYKTLFSSDSADFVVVEAKSLNPNKKKIYGDYREIMSVKLDIGKKVSEGYSLEARLSVDKLGLLTIEARPKDNPENTIKANVQLENLS